MPQDSVRVAFVGRLKNAALVEFMAEKGWPQSRLARELGVHDTLVSNWILLKAAPKNEAMLKKIERLLGMLREEIFPEFFRSREWRRIQKQLPKEHVVVREVPVQKLLQSGRLALPSPEAEYDKKELHEQLQAALQKLPKRSAQILRLRFGLGDEVEHTLQEVGDMFGISRDRVRQLEQTAVRKLRDPSVYNCLRTFTEEK